MPTRGRVNLKGLKKAMESKITPNRYTKFEAMADKMRAEEGWVRSGYGWEPMIKEFMFHPTRKWRADYAFPNKKLLVEIEGGFWTGGRHGRGGGAIKDMCKYNAATVMGFAILRFTPQQANNGEAIQVISDWFLANRREVQS